jgi:hypothetical protein
MEEKLSFLSDPDLLRHAQDRVMGASNGPLLPEKQLMLAVLEDGIACFRKYVLSGRPRFREAEAWLLEDDDRWPFSFRNVCEVLGLDANGIRDELLRWRGEHRSVLTFGSNMSKARVRTRRNSAEESRAKAGF